MSLVLSLDVGGGHVTAAAVDTHHRQVLTDTQVRRSVDPAGSAPALLSAWSESALEAWRLTATKPTHVGVAMPGPFEYGTGVARLTRKFSALYGVDVGAALRERWQGTVLQRAEVRFGNDAALFALGEWWAGEGQGTDRMVGVTLGTGFGAGFVRGGEPLYGGEDVPRDGSVWHLPLRGGIAEDLIGGPALSQAYQGRTGRVRDAREIASAAQAGDVAARQVYVELGRAMAEVLAHPLAAFGAQQLVVGGNIARAWPLFRDTLQTGLQGVDVRVSCLFEAANLLGAAALTQVAVGSH